MQPAWLARGHVRVARARSARVGHQQPGLRRDDGCRIPAGRLKAAQPQREGREAWGWRGWLRHRKPKRSDALTEVVRAVVRDGPLSMAEQAAYARVAAVLEDTFRASSAVECMNSVLRMQQSRHKRMTQPMLDLKRLYWNCHRFRSGPRKDLSPYQALRLELPSYDFWELLQSNPEKLTQELSTSRDREWDSPALLAV